MKKQKCDWCGTPTSYDKLESPICCYGEDYSICPKCLEHHKKFYHYDKTVYEGVYGNEEEFIK